MWTIRGGMRFPTVVPRWREEYHVLRTFRLAVPALLTAAFFVVSPGHAGAAGVSYYVDAAQGDDNASGMDSAHAWRSLTRVNRVTFHAGDRILLRAGGRWSGQLWPKGSGTSGSSVTVDRYGDGTNPRIDGGGLVNDAVRLV